MSLRDGVVVLAELGWLVVLLVVVVVLVYRVVVVSALFLNCSYMEQQSTSSESLEWILTSTSFGSSWERLVRLCTVLFFVVFVVW